VSNAAFISDEGNCDQNQHYDQDNALFVFREFENSELALHRSIPQPSLFNSRTPFSSLGFLQVVILSEAKNLRSFSFYTLTELIIRDVSPSLNMTRTAYLA